MRGVGYRIAAGAQQPAALSLENGSRPYPLKPFERSLRGFHFKGLWFIDTATNLFWRGVFSASMIKIPLSE